MNYGTVGTLKSVGLLIAGLLVGATTALVTDGVVPTALVMAATFAVLILEDRYDT
ncbi:hypothetical protein [Halorussus sp. MSC15.2]|uniref:hypothetical protein n=1 Tax=Halorussus sp. MSC15.2 TaxID=2283638 RepID=UPI0013D260FD|nr:hypothetical protein [Halorussus sp. MSC15.2]NEU58338.1 hypothetical protein [Halorussus sp. MSC15.2]